MSQTKAQLINAKGDAAFDTNTLYVDAANNRVGIGTSLPGGSLDVVAQSDASGINLRGRSADSIGTLSFYSNDGATNNAQIQMRPADNEFRILASGARAQTFYTNGSERVRIDSSGRVGIGTTTPSDQFVISNNGAAGFEIGTATNQVVAQAYNRSGAAYVNLTDACNNRIFQTGGNTERARIDSSGRLLVGTSSGSGKLIVQDSLPKIQSNFNGTSHLEFGTGGSGCGFAMTTGLFMTFNHQPYADRGTDNNLTQRMIIDGNGNVNVGGGGITARVAAASAATSTVVFYGYANTASYTSTVIQAQSETSAGTGWNLYLGYASSGNLVYRVYGNGNVQNTNNSYGAISDAKLKENIVDAGSQWNDLKALQVRKYNFKEGQTHTQIGLVAQEVELVSPGLVSESPDRDAEGNDLGTTTKSVNYSVLYMKAVKALQEAMERIEQLEAEMAAVKAQLS